jgi:hypothetical protein
VKRLPWFLILALFLGLAAPARPAAAASTLELRQLMPYGDIWHEGNLQPGGTIDRGLTELRIYFNYFLDEAASKEKLTVTNSQGEVQPWKVHVSTGFMLYPNWALNRGETYTIRIKGGPDGIKGEYGSTLPEDLVIPLHVEQRPFEITDMMAFGGAVGPVTDGGIIPRDARELRISFTRRIGSASVAVAGNVTVTDSKGQAAGWRPGAGSGDLIYFYIPQENGHLPKNETYTIRIKGGMGGVLSEAGVPLPQDLVLMVRTSDQAYERTVSFPSNRMSHGVIQTEIYKIQAEAGPLTIHLDGWPEQGETNVVLEDPQTPEVLLDAWFSSSGKQYETVELPRSGTYTLVLAPNRAWHINVKGLDLTMSKVTPAMRFTPGEPYATRNGRFAFAPELLNPSDTEAVRIMLDDEVVNAKALAADGSITPTYFDPREMADGIYNVAALAKAKGGSNLSVVEESFLVDRVDAFADVPAGHWARRHVEVMYHLEILSGRGEGLFAPGQPVRRAEFAKMLALTLGLEATGYAPVPFADMRDDWAKPYISALYEAGLIKGEVVGGKTYFYPDRTISRAEASTIIGRYLEIADEEVGSGAQVFGDEAQIPAWARSSVLILADARWITGFPDGRFMPGANLNRDQAAKILANFLGM